jgi:hypothetical protein
MLGKNLVRVLGPIWFSIRIGHVEIDDNIGALCPKPLDDEISMLFIS